MKKDYVKYIISEIEVSRNHGYGFYKQVKGLNIYDSSELMTNVLMRKNMVFLKEFESEIFKTLC